MPNSHAPPPVILTAEELYELAIERGMQSPEFMEAADAFMCEELHKSRAARGLPPGKSSQLTPEEEAERDEAFAAGFTNRKAWRAHLAKRGAPASEAETSPGADTSEREYLPDN